MRRSDSHGGETGVRQRVIDAAVDLFAEQGFDATSVAEIVARANVTKGAMYHYFTSKDDLLFEIYRPLLDEQLKNLDAIMAMDLAPAERIAAIVRSTIETTAARSKAVAVFSRESARLTAARWEELSRDWQRFQDTVRGIIRDGQASGDLTTLASPIVISWALFSISNSMPTWFRPDGAKSAGEIADEFTAFILAGLHAGMTP